MADGFVLGDFDSRLGRGAGGGVGRAGKRNRFLYLDGARGQSADDRDGGGGDRAGDDFCDFRSNGGVNRGVARGLGFGDLCKLLAAEIFH